VDDAERAELVARLPPRWVTAPLPVPDVRDLGLRAPRVVPPAALAEVCTTDTRERAGHSVGKAYRDVIRALRGELAPPDVVAFPTSEADVVDLLDWASGVGVAVVPYGGGSSVVGGVEFRGDGPHLCMDLTRLDRVLEVDRVSRAARIQAGALGPVLESQLAGHGLTLRHFLQSFEFSTLGGWIATRAGGHFATRQTHIDDMVEALRVVSPRGTTESLRVPASGAGPSPDRLFLGSEGALGIITEAWVRVLDRPVHKAADSVIFGTFEAALDSVRVISQSGLDPSNCRLLDAAEAAINTSRADGACVLLLGFESADHPVHGALARAVEIANDFGGLSTRASTEDPAPVTSAWRTAFLRMPYRRDALARSGVIVETFETSCTWDKAAGVISSVRDAVAAAITEICGEPGIVTCRLTHVYPDGVAPYFTVIGRARAGSEVRMWDDIKTAASEVLVRAGASITHHHAVGRDHLPWYERQRPDLFAQVLRAAKDSLDPSGILNPGVLFD
jgi:alkyldihydroxyacetonephosphate synthase